MVKIINLDLIREKINKFDSLANVDMTKPNSISPQKSDDVSDKMKKFFEVADGNPDWNVWC